MDAGRFDSLSRSFATRSSRRAALRGLGAGGLAAGVFAALGGDHAPAASGTCALKIFAKTSAGPHKDTTYAGTLTFTIGDNGAIDSGSFDVADGSHLKLVGQATGRALNLRVTLADGGILALNGTADNDLIVCRGAASGVFGGPSDTDIGTWRTGDRGSSKTTGGGSTSSGGGAATGGGTTGGGGGASTGTGGGATTGSGGGDAGGGGNTTGAGGGGGAACPSGVVCAGVCCAAAPGLTPDTMVCNAGACECTYSCAAAGCAGNAQGSIVNTCGSDPQPHCHSECNAPATNGCGDLTCAAGTTLNADTCACDPAGGGGAACQAPTVACGAVCCPSGSICTDPANGNCHCPDGTELCINSCVPSCADGSSPDPNSCQCIANGGGGCVLPLVNCGDSQNVQCVDVTSDAQNCGRCSNVCLANQICVGNVCIN